MVALIGCYQEQNSLEFEYNERLFKLKEENFIQRFINFFYLLKNKLWKKSYFNFFI